MQNPILVFLIINLLFVGGCAKTHVGNIHESTAANMQRPSRILIQNFAADMQNVQTSTTPLAKLKGVIGDDSPEKAKQELTQEVVEALTQELSEKIKSLGYTAVIVATDAQPQKGDLMITGKILDMDEGNAVRRNLIGLGAGQSSLNSEINVVAGTNSGTQQLMNFNAHADSGNMPGVAVMGPAGAAAGAGAAAAAANVAKGAATTYKSSSAYQAKSMADSIVDEISKYYKTQGWAIGSQ